MSDDPIHTDPDKYHLLFENDRVRVLEYRDRPGDRTSLHSHPDSVMCTLSTFDRRLTGGDGQTRDVTLVAGTTGWLPAQQHAGENVGASETHVIFVELKEASPSASAGQQSAVEPGPAFTTSVPG